MLHRVLIASDTESMETNMHGAQSIAHYEACTASRTRLSYGAGMAALAAA